MECQATHEGEHKGPFNFVRFSFKSKGMHYPRSVQPVALAQALGKWDEDDMKKYMIGDMEDYFYKPPVDNWDVTSQEKLLGGLSKEKVMICSDEEEEEEDKKMPALGAGYEEKVWENLEDKDKRYINWYVCELSTRDCKVWREKVRRAAESKPQGSPASKRTRTSSK
jgi:hypothetical protein